MNYIKHLSIKFAKNNHLYGKGITFKKLLKVSRQNGFLVNFYSTSRTLIFILGLEERAENSSSVSIVDENKNVCIFIDDSISKYKQLFALAHEIGHILLRHKPDSKKRKAQECEANLFAHYLLINENDKKHREAVAIFSIVATMLILATILLFTVISPVTKEETISASQHSYVSKVYTETIPAELVTVAPENSAVNSFAETPKQTETSSEETTTYFEESTAPTESYETSTETSQLENSNDSIYNSLSENVCYYTPSGEVYHLYKDCHYLKNSKTIYTDTIDKCNKNRLCSACERKQSKE